MRILALSDVHGAIDTTRRIIENESGYDVVVMSGDAAPYGAPRGAVKVLRKISELVSPRLLIAVPGNMDDPSAYEELQGSNGNIRIVHGRSISVGDIVLVGVGGSPPTPFRTVFEMSEDEIARILEQAIHGVNSTNVVLISHAPPYKTKCDKVVTGLHVGSKAVRSFIEQKKPILCICGHIHESRAVDRIGSTIIVNPGPAMRGFYAVIEVSRGSVEAELKRI